MICGARRARGCNEQRAGFDATQARRTPLAQNGLLCCKGTYRNHECRVIGIGYTKELAQGAHQFSTPRTLGRKGESTGESQGKESENTTSVIEFCHT
jgi:hypothetical protein